MTFKEKVENNVIIWLLGTLLVGFLSGIATYKGILEIAGQTTISKEALIQLNENNASGDPDPSISKASTKGMNKLDIEHVNPGVFSIELGSAKFLDIPDRKSRSLAVLFIYEGSSMLKVSLDGKKKEIYVGESFIIVKGQFTCSVLLVKIDEHEKTGVFSYTCK